MSPLDMPPLPTGTRIGGDVVEAILGAGGFGTVYQVRGPDGHRSALKLVPLAAGEDGATFRKLLEKVAREHTAGCGRATCGSCADWSRVLRAHADLVRAQQVPQEVGAYAAWVDEVARFSFPT